MGSIYLRKYGVETTVDFCLYKLDGTGLKTDAASASGDVTLYRDEAAVETLDADAFVDEGAIYSLVLSATEMNAARIIICIVDQSSPQVWLDKTLIIETYGNASAQHAFDLDTATQDVNLTATAVDNIWDELMAGHVTPDSAAYVMRSLTSLISGVNLAQAGAAGSITLAAASSAVNDFYKGQTICIVLGAGAGQARACYAYNGGTKVASIRPNWATAPDNTSYYAILNVGSSVIAAIDDIDFSATMLTSLDAATPSVTVSDKTGFSLSAAGIDGIWDEVIEGALTGRQTLRLNLAALCGKSSGGGTATITFRDTGDGTDRIVATVTADGNRTNMVLDVT